MSRKFSSQNVRVLSLSSCFINFWFCTNYSEMGFEFEAIDNIWGWMQANNVALAVVSH